MDIDLSEQFVRDFNELLEDRNRLRESPSENSGVADAVALHARQAELEEELRELRQKLEAAGQQLIDAAQRRDDLERRLTESQQQLAEEQRLRRETQGLLTQTSKSLSDALERLARVDARTPTEASQLPGDESPVNEYREKISSLERLVASRDHDITGLKVLLGHLEDEKNALVSLNIGLEEQIEQLQEEFKSRR